MGGDDFDGSGDVTEQEILTILDRWRDALQACEEPMDTIIGLFAGCPDGPPPDAVFALQGAYTAEVAERLTCCPDMLTDWWLVHRFGAEAMEVGWVGGPLRKLESNADMAKFIFDCNAGGGEGADA